MPNKFIIKINKDSQGNELSLESMPIEAAESLKIFIDSLTQFAKMHEHESDVRLSLKNGCVENALIYSETETSIADEIEEIIEGKADNNDSIKLFKAIQDRVKANGLDYSVLHTMNHETINLTEKFKAKNFPYNRGPRKEHKEKVLFVVAYLYEAGGDKTTNIHLRIDDEKIKVKCTEEEAKRLNQRLYDNVFIAVLKKWKIGSKPSFTLLDSYISRPRFEEYQLFYQSIISNNTLERFDILHDKFVDVYTNSENNGELLKYMRIFNYTQCDRGVLRTILMTLKPIKSRDEKIEELYLQLAEKLRKGSLNNFI
jgi:hypothetical protein